jgi:hypothetical protein
LGSSGSPIGSKLANKVGGRTGGSNVNQPEKTYEVTIRRFSVLERPPRLLVFKIIKLQAISENDALEMAKDEVDPDRVKKEYKYSVKLIN